MGFFSIWKYFGCKVSKNFRTAQEFLLLIAVFNV